MSFLREKITGSAPDRTQAGAVVRIFIIQRSPAVDYGQQPTGHIHLAMPSEYGRGTDEETARK